MPPTINMGIPGASSSVTGGVTGKRVLLAEPRGYCAGVDRAVETVERALEKHGAPVYVRHEIVHNVHVVETLAKAGAIFVDETDEVPEGAIVVFSAHGVAPTVHQTAAERNLKVIDATCPLVTKVHNEAKRFARDDYDILLIGHEGHEEVVGTAGEAPDHVQLVDGPDSVDNVTIRNENKVKVLDLRGALPSLVAEVPIGGMPDTMQLTRDGKTLVVGLRAIPQMALLDTRTLSVRPVTFMGYGISGHQSLSPNGRLTYIALESAVTSRPGAIGVVDNRSGDVIDTWEYPGGPWPHGVYFDRQVLR